MYTALVVCVACLGSVPANLAAAGSPSNTPALAAYQQARENVGQDADAHVRLSLWCENHGLSSERLKHLTIAVLYDPSHARARGLLGLVAFRGRWQLPDEIRKNIQADEARSANLAEYNARRTRMRNSADAHMKIAIWCEEHGLTPEATAHLTVATQLDPGLDAAWKRLGYKKHGSRWITDLQLAEWKAESDARSKADKHWTTVLARVRSGLEDQSTRADAAKTLQGITDPSAVPAAWAIFVGGNISHQRLAVQLFGQIDSPRSTRALSLLAVASESGEVRGKSIETLRRRDPHDIASFLVGLLRDPVLDSDPILYRYALKPTGWDSIGSIGFLVVRGPLYDILRTYTVNESSLILTPDAMTDVGYPARVMRQRQRQLVDLGQIIRQLLSESESLIEAAKDHIRAVDELNARIIRVLSTVNGHNLGPDRQAWRKWWTEERGYAYISPPSPTRQDLTLSDDKPVYVINVPPTSSCFAGGTPVHTITGARTIESVQVGDQVLTQDPGTAELTYQPVVAAVQNKPDRLVDIDLGGEVIRATSIHRFWKAGQGWVPARDLKSGDSLRVIGGIATVKGVRGGQVQPVFNLKVMQAQSFFVGERGILVHDNSSVEPVLQPFDVVPGSPGDH
jgi:hypothetical protein